MLTSTFKHCYGVANTLNARIVAAGCTNWDEALRYSERLPFSPARRKGIIEELAASQAALARNDIAYLLACFPTEERWRLLAHYWADLAFLDLETTGLSPYNSHITVAALVTPQAGLQHFVRGENLPDLLPALEGCRLLVTFGGGSFDVPRLVDHFRIPELPCPHVDLRWQCYHLGLTGGLKAVERQLKMVRPPELAGIDGLQAIRLWQEHLAGDADALRRLKGYVGLDTTALKELTGAILRKRGCVLDA